MDEAFKSGSDPSTELFSSYVSANVEFPLSPSSFSLEVPALRGFCLLGVDMGVVLMFVMLLSREWPTPSLVSGLPFFGLSGTKSTSFRSIRRDLGFALVPEEEKDEGLRLVPPLGVSGGE